VFERTAFPAGICALESEPAATTAAAADEYTAGICALESEPAATTAAAADEYTAGICALESEPAATTAAAADEYTAGICALESEPACAACAAEDVEPACRAACAAAAAEEVEPGHSRAGVPPSRRRKKPTRINRPHQQLRQESQLLLNDQRGACLPRGAAVLT
jgi:hypothetical protein